MWIRPAPGGHRRAITDVFTPADQRVDPGTRTSVKLTSAVHAPSWPILVSFGAHLNACGVRGNQEHGDPGPLSSAGRVRRTPRTGRRPGALVMNRFAPESTQLASSRTALVRRPAGSDPAPGSVSAKEATTSPDAIDSSQRPSARRCRSRPEPVPRCRCWCRTSTEAPARCSRTPSPAERPGQGSGRGRPLLRDRVAEQAHLLGMVAQVVGTHVVRISCSRDHGGANEVTVSARISPGRSSSETSAAACFGGGHRQTLLVGDRRSSRRPGAGRPRRNRHEARSYRIYDIRSMGYPRRKHRNLTEA